MTPFGIADFGFRISECEFVSDQSAIVNSQSAIRRQVVG